MSDDQYRDPGLLENDAILVRTMQDSDLDSVVAIDATGTGRQRPAYFSHLIKRTVESADMQISLVAESEGRVIGFAVATLFYGEFGLMEPSASIDVIGVEQSWRRKHVGAALMRQLRLNLGALRVTSVRTEVSWSDFDLLAFFQKEGFAPSDRLCLERQLDPSEPET
jgi:GNAT superfamily N-acetyltransferase